MKIIERNMSADVALSIVNGIELADKINEIIDKLNSLPNKEKIK